MSVKTASTIAIRANSMYMPSVKMGTEWLVARTLSPNTARANEIVATVNDVRKGA